MIGFLEESEGVRSMSRLTILMMSILASVIVGTTCYLVARGMRDAAVICAMGGMLLTIVAKGAVAIINRNPPADEK